MKPLFADTSFYIAFINERDAHHEVAVAASQQRRQQVTTGYVLVEIGNWLAKIDRVAFAQLLADLRADPNTLLVPASRDLLDKACRLYGERSDKEWSLTDCTSIIVMQEQGRTDALTTDHHFEQAGFRALLREQRKS
jgi:uncharacterized protein